MVVVIDSNVLVSALLSRDPASPTVVLFRQAIEGTVSAQTSAFQLAELVDVLMRPKFRRLVSVQDALRFVGLIKETFHVVAGFYQDLDLVPRDAKDNPIVAIGLEAGARYLITDDFKHLLPLRVVLIPGHKPLQIVSLEDFNGLETAQPTFT